VPVLRLPQLPAAAGKQHWGNLPGAALSLAIAEAASAAKRFTLLLTADSQSAERLEQELSFFAPDLPVLHFPDWETLPYDLFSPHQDIISQRIASLYRLPELPSVCRKRIAVSSVTSRSWMGLPAPAAPETRRLFRRGRGYWLYNRTDQPLNLDLGR
jgi:transcription-repair coupling factor (superfamily II helicase)